MILYLYRLNEKHKKNQNLKRRKVNNIPLEKNKWHVSRIKLEKFKPLINSKEIIEKLGDDKHKIEEYILIKEEKKIEKPKKKVESIEDTEIEYDLPEEKPKRKYTKRTYKKKEKK